MKCTVIPAPQRHRRSRRSRVRGDPRDDQLAAAPRPRERRASARQASDPPFDTLGTRGGGAASARSDRGREVQLQPERPAARANRLGMFVLAREQPPAPSRERACAKPAGRARRSPRPSNSCGSRCRSRSERPWFFDPPLHERHCRPPAVKRPTGSACAKLAWIRSPPQRLRAAPVRLAFPASPH